MSGADRLKAMFVDAVENLTTDFLPNETIRAAKRRRTQAAMTVEAIRHRLIDALASFAEDADDEETTEVKIDDIEAIKDRRRITPTKIKRITKKPVKQKAKPATKVASKPVKQKAKPKKPKKPQKLYAAKIDWSKF